MLGKQTTLDTASFIPYNLLNLLKDLFRLNPWTLDALNPFHRPTLWEMKHKYINITENVNTEFIL